VVAVFIIIIIIIPGNDVCKFLLEAADQEWILQKVVLMMGIFGSRRCDELCKMMSCYSYYWLLFSIYKFFFIKSNFNYA
jgi:hypothetical protein